MTNEIVSGVSEVIRVELIDTSDAALAVYSTRRLTAAMGFSVTNQYLIAAAVSELATNIVRYAGQGKITIKTVRNADLEGVEVEARDEGPGIADIDQAMQEHFSSGNSLGLGLPSVRRIMDEFIIDSKPGRGTTIIARKWR
ncbi:MAG: anti-sigma regulatory factor [Deltaproteobacteria bacterium]|nr:anti-sigma regulatory factor [Deltaproteobacteria bacterium]